MIYFDSDMSKSTNTVVYFDWKTGNLYLRLWKMSHTIYAALFEQTIIHQHIITLLPFFIEMLQYDWL